jgi:hypothetical protein
MPLRDAFGHFIGRAEAASEPAPVEVIEPAPAPLPAAQRFAEAQAAWQEHQEELANLRDRITSAAEARRQALGDEDWERVAALDAQIAAFRTRIEGGALRDRSLAQAITIAEEALAQAQQEALRLPLERAIEALCLAAHNLVVSVDRVRALQIEAGVEAPLMEGQFVSTHLIRGWSEWHRRKTHREAA